MDDLLRKFEAKFKPLRVDMGGGEIEGQKFSLSSYSHGLMVEFDSGATYHVSVNDVVPAAYKAEFDGTADVEPTEFDEIVQAAREYMVYLLSDWKDNVEEYETVRHDFLNRFNAGVKAHFDHNRKGVNNV
jgi:hypothetical protein